MSKLADPRPPLVCVGCGAVMERLACLGRPRERCPPCRQRRHAELNAQYRARHGEAVLARLAARRAADKAAGILRGTPKPKRPKVSDEEKRAKQKIRYLRRQARLRAAREGAAP